MAKSIGDTYALEVYNSLLDITRKTCLELDCNKYLFYSQAIEEDKWSGDSFIKMVQKGDGLGHRMKQAFEYAFGIDSRVVIIGSDCPSISSELISSAFSKLDIADVVIGPSEDAGYYLMGMNNYYPQLFEDINWSTEEVLPQTIAKIKESGLLFTQLPLLNDIDTIEDLRAFPELIPDQLDLTSL